MCYTIRGEINEGKYEGLPEYLPELIYLESYNT